MPSSAATGPLTMSTIADPPVLLAGPWYAKSGWQRLFTAATTTGAYAGRQPAMTALMARLSAVTTALRPWISPTISSPRSFAPPSGFIFDQEIIAQVVAADFRIAEIAVPTRYFRE